jgi:ATP:ADP antiporter, AAA family
LSNFTEYFFPGFEEGELKKFIYLSVIFAFIVGTYWFLRPIKDGVFITMLGAEYLPYAKILSVVVIIPLITFYGKLIDHFSRDRVFYILSFIFGLITLLFAYLIMHPNFGMYSTEKNLFKVVIGLSWCVYVKIFGSVMVALFWSFVADTTTPESAERGYSIVAIGGQVGNVIGPLIVGIFAENFGVAFLALFSSIVMFLFIPLMYFFVRTVSSCNLRGFQGENRQDIIRKNLGLFDGFKFLLSSPYLLSIYGIISIFEVVQAIFDYRFKTLAGLYYSGDQLVQYLGNFGAITGLVAVVCALLGTQRITKLFGITVALLVLPVSLFILVFFNAYSSLTIAMWALILTRAINYALNQPSKEQLYITTSKEAKYKAKAWIEIFGTRTSEAFAQGVNIAKVSLGQYFLIFSTLLSFGLLGVWLVLAVFLGRKYKKAVDSNKFIC